MHEMKKLVAWLARLDAIATAVIAWRANSEAQFSCETVLQLLEQQIGWNVVEVV